MRRFFLSILIISSIFISTPAFTAETNVLLGKDYFQATRQAIQNAKESIYVAIYFISVDPIPTDNPASILLEDLISAKKRGVRVKVILEDTTFKVNYNAYKRLQQAGVDVSLDSAKAVLHGKGIIIDSRISIIGSFNWSRSSLSDNYEFATYIEDPQQAKKLLEYISKIEISLNPPIQPQQLPGLKLPLNLLIGPPKPPLFDLYTNRAEGAFDLYLYLLKKAQNSNSKTIKINYQEFRLVIGDTNKDYRNIMRIIRRLSDKYKLIERNSLTHELNLKDLSSTAYIIIPDAYWDYGFCRKLSLTAKYMYLVSLNEAQESGHNPYWFKSNRDLVEKYKISNAPMSHAISELEKKNILEVYRNKPQDLEDFSNRQANRYRLNPLQSPEQFQQALDVVSNKYGIEITQQACQLSAQLNEPKDLEKVEIYIGLIKTYGYKKVREVNSKVASNSRQSGFRDITQVILLLKSFPRKP